MGMSGSAFAATPNDTQQEIQELKTRLAALEAQVAKAQKQAARPQAQKKQDFKFYGDTRIRSISSDGGDYSFEQRLRLNVEKQINQHTTVHVRDILMNENPMGESGSTTTTSSKGKLTSSGGTDTQNKIDNAYVEISGLWGNPYNALKAGRFGHNFGVTGYWSSEGSLGMYDGMELTFGNRKASLSTGFGNWGGAKDAAGDAIQVSSTNKASIVQGTDTTRTTLNKLEHNVFLKVGYAPDRTTKMQLWHIRETNADYSPVDYEVTGFGVKHKLNRNLTLAYDYSRNAGIDGAPTGNVAMLTYGNAEYDQPGSKEFRFYYINVDKGNVASPLTKSINIPCNDNRGWGFSAHCVLYKNIMAEFLTEFEMQKKSTGDHIGSYYRFQISSKI